MLHQARKGSILNCDRGSIPRKELKGRRAQAPDPEHDRDARRPTRPCHSMRIPSLARSPAIDLCRYRPLWWWKFSYLILAFRAARRTIKEFPPNDMGVGYSRWKREVREYLLRGCPVPRRDQATPSCFPCRLRQRLLISALNCEPPFFYPNYEKPSLTIQPLKEPA